MAQQVLHLFMHDVELPCQNETTAFRDDFKSIGLKTSISEITSTTKNKNKKTVEDSFYPNM